MASSAEPLPPSNPADNRSGEIILVMILFLSLAWVTFPLRLWVRFKKLKNVAADDILIIMTMGLFSVFAAWVLFAAHYGSGRHNADLKPQALIEALKGWYLAETFYILSCLFLKVAFGVFLLQVAIEPVHRQIIWFLIGLNILYYIFYFFQSIFQCLPVNHYWYRVNPQHKGSCHNPSFVANSTYAQSVLSILTDFTYALVPVLIVKDLQMSRYKRASLSLMLGLGAVASIAVIVRIPYVVNLATSNDFLWETTDVVIWSCVEPGLGLTILNLVVTRPLFRSLFAKIGSITSAANTRRTKSTGYAKQSYGASTLIGSTNGQPRCGNPACICHCHKPCTCGKQTFYHEPVTPEDDIESAYQMGNITSPRSAHLSSDKLGIHKTMEIETSSEPRSDVLRAVREGRASLAMTRPSEDRERLFVPPLGRKAKYGAPVRSPGVGQAV